MRFAITLTVDASADGRTLHAWLAYMLLDETPASIATAIDSGWVTIDTQVSTDRTASLTPGQEVRFQQAPSV